MLDSGTADALSDMATTLVAATAGPVSSLRVCHPGELLGELPQPAAVGFVLGAVRDLGLDDAATRHFQEPRGP